MIGYLRSSEFSEHLVTKASGSVQLNFGPTHLRRINLRYPNEELIDKYQSIALPLLKKYIETKKENDYLRNIRNTILPKLMSGEIRAPIDGLE